MKMIQLTRGMVALVDDDDFTRFGHLSWYAQPGWRATFYAARRLPRKEGGTMIWLHKEIMNAAPNDYVDHRSGNTLDNQKSNLRVSGQTKIILQDLRGFTGTKEQRSGWLK